MTMGPPAYTVFVQENILTKKTLCITADEIFYKKKETHSIMDSPKLKNFKTLLIQPQEIESKAF